MKMTKVNPKTSLTPTRLLLVWVLVGLMALVYVDRAWSRESPRESDDEDWSAPEEIAQKQGVHRGKVKGNKTRRQWITEGNACGVDDVTVIENGSTISILLNRFQLQIQEGDFAAGLAKSIFCKFSMDLTPPPGQRLVGFRQTFSGSILKSRDARAVLDVQYRMGQKVVDKLPFVWKRGEPITPTDERSVFAISVRNKVKSKCRPSLPYVLRLDLSGVRDSRRQDFVMAGIDSVDGDFVVDVEPVFEACLSAGERR